MNAGDVKVRLIADLTKFNANMTKATGLIQGFARLGTGSVRALSRSLRSLTGLPALGVGAMFAGSVREMASFEEQMAKVSTMLDEQSMKLMPQYSKSVRKMAMQFGEGTATISRGLYQTLSASIEPAKAIDFLTVSMKAAKAGMTDTETAADTLTTMLNAYGYGAEYAGLMSDRLFGIVKRGKTEFPKLAASLGNVASGAALVGMDIEILGAALATMTRSGLDTAEAVTALNRLIMSFNKPRGDAVKTAEKFGIAMDSTTLAGTGLLDVLNKLQKATPKELASIASRETGYKALAIMLQHVKEVEYDYQLQLKTTGATQEQYNKMVNTLMHRLKQLWQVIKVVAIDAVQPLSDDLKQAVDWLVKHQQTMSNWATKLGAYMVYLKDMTVAFIKLMSDSPQKGFEVLLDSLIIVIQRAGELAIDMAIRIGEGIWQGVKKGIFGEKLEELEDLTRQLYEAQVSQYANQPAAYKMGFKGKGQAAGYAEVPAFPEEYAEAERAAATQLRQEVTDSLWAGLGDEWKSELQAAGDQISETFKGASEEAARAAEEASARLKKTLASIEPAADGAGEAMEEAGKAGASSFIETADAVGKLTQEFPEGDDFTKATLDIVALTAQLYDEIDSRTKESFEARRRLLKQQYEEYAQHVKDRLALDAWYKDQSTKLEEERVKATGGFWAGMRVGISEMQREMQTMGDLGAEFGQTLRDGLVDSFADALLEARNLSEGIKELGRSIARMVTEWAMAQAVTRGLNWLFPSGGGAATTAASVAHGGGTFGRDSFPTRSVPTGVFAIAPRLHKGLFAPDEYPAILQRGETVNPRGHNGSPKVSVQVNNYGTRKDVTTTPPQWNGREYVVGVILDDLDYGGPLSERLGQ